LQYYVTVSLSSSLDDLSYFRAVKLDQSAYYLCASGHHPPSMLHRPNWVVLDRKLWVLLLGLVPILVLWVLDTSLCRNRWL